MIGAIVLAALLSLAIAAGALGWVHPFASGLLAGAVATFALLAAVGSAAEGARR